MHIEILRPGIINKQLPLMKHADALNTNNSKPGLKVNDQSQAVSKKISFQYDDYNLVKDSFNRDIYVEKNTTDKINELDSKSANNTGGLKIKSLESVLQQLTGKKIKVLAIRDNLYTNDDRGFISHVTFFDNAIQSRGINAASNYHGILDSDESVTFYIEGDVSAVKMKNRAMAMTINIKRPMLKAGIAAGESLINRSALAKTTDMGDGSMLSISKIVAMPGSGVMDNKSHGVFGSDENNSIYVKIDMFA